MIDRIPLDNLTSDQLDALYDRADTFQAAWHSAKDRAVKQRKRAEQAEAATERVRNLRAIAPDGAKGPTWAALDLAICNALDQLQQPTA